MMRVAIMDDFHIANSNMFSSFLFIEASVHED